ncbi:MAG: response regulator transcription factor [Verrucomicrobiota bacterium]
MTAGNENQEPPLFRTLIIEDQGMMKAFFEHWLGGLPEFVVVVSAKSGEEAMARVLEARPHVALVDFQLPGMDGLEFMRAARQLWPQLRTLVVSSLMDALTLTRIRESGAEGYLEKEASPELLATALRKVAAGGHWYSPKFRATMDQDGANSEGVGKILSRREQQVMAFVLARRNNREIAELMGLSTRTVEFHRGNLMTKLNAHNIAELIASARQRGWTEPG